MTFEKSDGMRISINVPPGKRPGDFFEVSPPALMVLVPEGVRAGDIVVFSMPAPPAGQWFKAQVPEDLQLGKYFAARLPPPGALQAKGGGAKATAVAAVAATGVKSEAALGQGGVGPESADGQDQEEPVE